MKVDFPGTKNGGDCGLTDSFDLIFGRGNNSKRHVRNVVYTHSEIKSYPANICITFTNRVGTWRS